MNFYEFIMMLFYVSFCTGIISIGCHYSEKLNHSGNQDFRKLSLLMKNLDTDGGDERPE